MMIVSFLMYTYLDLSLCDLNNVVGVVFSELGRQAHIGLFFLCMLWKNRHLY